SRLISAGSRPVSRDNSERRTAPALRDAARIVNAGWERNTPDRSALRRAPSRPVAMRARRASATSTRRRSSRRFTSTEVRGELAPPAPHREVRRRPPVWVSERDLGPAALVVARRAPHLVRRFETADEARGPDGVRREDPSRRVHGEASAELRLTCVGQRPPLPFRRAPVPFQPHPPAPRSAA